ncbi:MAG: hypothetical protein PHO10_03460 [Gemmiger sp.]|nr:hypothetical protein [Gemmiger sp.]
MAGKYSDYCKNRAQHCTIHTYDLETGTVTDLIHFDTAVEAPNWTKDGKYLIYNSMGKLWRLDLATKAITAIPTGMVDTCNNDHVLAPDGSGIACSSGQNDDETSNIYLVDYATGTAKRVVSENLSYLHGWSPDGKTLAFCAGRAYQGRLEWDIYTVPVEGGPETRLTNAPGLNDGPEYSPDGKKIWFNSVRTGLMQAYVMNADGSAQTQMTFDEDMNTWFPHISPDNTKVVYIAYHKGDLEPGQHLPDLNVEIRMIPAAGGTPKTLVKLFGGQGSMNVNSWSPDSKQFAFVSYHR